MNNYQIVEVQSEKVAKLLKSIFREYGLPIESIKKLPV